MEEEHCVNTSQLYLKHLIQICFDKSCSCFQRALEMRFPSLKNRTRPRAPKTSICDFFSQSFLPVTLSPCPVLPPPHQDPVNGRNLLYQTRRTQQSREEVTSSSSLLASSPQDTGLPVFSSRVKGATVKLRRFALPQTSLRMSLPSAHTKLQSAVGICYI